MSDNKSFEQMAVEQESGYPVTEHDFEPDIDIKLEDVVGKGMDRREAVEPEKIVPKPKLATLDKESINTINGLFEKQGGKLDSERIIFYDKDLVSAGKAHQDLVNGLTASDVYKSRGPNDPNSQYSGISNASFGAGEGLILTFSYPKTMDTESQRAKTDKLLRHANSLLEAVGAQILIPIEVPKK